MNATETPAEPYGHSERSARVKQRYSIKRAAEELEMSDRQLHHRIKQGKIRVVRDGRRLYITHAELRRYARTSNG